MYSSTQIDASNFVEGVDRAFIIILGFFLKKGRVGIEFIKHAFLLAIISYIALVYIVHLEARKMGLEGMEKKVTRTIFQRLTSFVATVLFMIIMAGVTYYGLGWIKGVAGAATIYIVVILLADHFVHH